LVRIKVIPEGTNDSTESLEDSLDCPSDMSWILENSTTSFESSDKEPVAKVFALESIPQVIRQAGLVPKLLQKEDPRRLLLIVKFGPILASMKKGKYIHIPS
jgi:hypothetical protein